MKIIIKNNTLEKKKLQNRWHHLLCSLLLGLSTVVRKTGKHSKVIFSEKILLCICKIIFKLNHGESTVLKPVFLLLKREKKLDHEKPKVSQKKSLIKLRERLLHRESNSTADVEQHQKIFLFLFYKCTEKICDFETKKKMIRIA